MSGPKDNEAKSIKELLKTIVEFCEEMSDTLHDIRRNQFESYDLPTPATPTTFVGQVQFPKFNPYHLDLWFEQIERFFDLSHVSSEIDQVRFVKLHLDVDVLMIIENTKDYPLEFKSTNNVFLKLKDRIHDVLPHIKKHLESKKKQ